MRGTDQFSYTQVKEFFVRNKNDNDYVLGVDEAGRGPWAGPMTASVVILRTGTTLKNVKDSKKMTELSRENAVDEIWEKAVYYATEAIMSEEIDSLGIGRAWDKLMVSLLEGAYKKFPGVSGVVDGTVRVRGFNKVVAVPKADNIVLSVSAASVLAKYMQTCWMDDYASKYPGYGFEQHRGYGTQAHLDALERKGVCPIHRMSFRPIKKILSRTVGS